MTDAQEDRRTALQQAATEGRPRTTSHQDLGDIAQAIRAQQHLIQALLITQAQHGEAVARHGEALETFRCAHEAKLDHIIATLDRLVAASVPADAQEQRVAAEFTNIGPSHDPAGQSGREVPYPVPGSRAVVADPLDDDLRAWHEQDSTRPRIGILGPVTVATPGQEPANRRTFHAEIIVFLANCGSGGATREQLAEAIWPGQRIKSSSRRVAITRTRQWLGETTDGTPWLPDMGPDGIYRLHEGFLLDWHLFRRLRARGESRGAAGANDYRAALELLRGAPLEGALETHALATRSPFSWLPGTDIHPRHIASAIVDTANRLAALYLQAGDTAGARWALDFTQGTSRIPGMREPYKADRQADDRLSLSS